jgi:hypothetical protein
MAISIRRSSKKYCTSAELQQKALAAARFRWENQETRLYRYFVVGET